MKNDKLPKDVRERVNTLIKVINGRTDLINSMTKMINSNKEELGEAIDEYNLLATIHPSLATIEEESEILAKINFDEIISQTFNISPPTNHLEVKQAMEEVAKLSAQFNYAKTYIAIKVCIANLSPSRKIEIDLSGDE